VNTVLGFRKAMVTIFFAMFHFDEEVKNLWNLDTAGSRNVFQDSVSVPSDRKLGLKVRNSRLGNPQTKHKFLEL